MTTTRAFLVGVGAVVAFVLAGHAHSPWWLLAPPVALLGTALFAGGADGWWTRAGRGLLGGIVAAVSGIALVLVLREHVDWFDWPADTGGDIFYLLLAAFTALPAMLCCFARPKLRTAFVAGFDLAFAALLLRGSPPFFGGIVLIALGTIVGAAMALRD